MRMSIGYLEPLVLFFLVPHLCMQIYASPPIFIIIQRRNYKEKQFFSKFLAGVELAISASAVQCLLHWATAAGLARNPQKLIFNSKCRFQAPSTFQNGRFASSIGHFTVVCLVTWHLSGSEAGGDLVLIQTLLLFICKCKLVSMRTT